MPPIAMPAGKLPNPDERCGLGCCRPTFVQSLADIRIFTFLMSVIIAIQGMYLGYIVGVQTSIERRFEVSSSEIGTLLAMYDIGHTISVVFVGHFGSHGRKPRWTGGGVVLSAIAMVCMSSTDFIFPHSILPDGTSSSAMTHFYNQTRCIQAPTTTIDDVTMNSTTALPHSGCVTETVVGAYLMLALCQFVAGVAAAPFNTLAYIYIDDNVSRRQSPFYLGILTSMYAFGPALGFGLSAACNYIYVNPFEPVEIQPDNPIWVGAWWLGFLVCAALYLICGIPIFFFPKKMPNRHNLDAVQMDELDPSYKMSYDDNDDIRAAQQCSTFLDNVKALPLEIISLLKNPIFTSMTFGWIFGAYLVGGYGTFLPKYIEHQYHKSSSVADIYAGIISIGSVATSTAAGGYILARFNIRPRKAILLLVISWSVIVATYLVGLATGCAESPMAGNQASETRWNFSTACNAHCSCENIVEFEPVCSDETGLTYFSPCHAGCEAHVGSNHSWVNCACSNGTSMHEGFCEAGCTLLPVYMVTTFVGLFVGNLFFMTTMMIILRSVHDEQKALALSFASSLTNIFGFIPSPIVFGFLIDTACNVWHSQCPDTGNCIHYDNDRFRNVYHIGNAGFQFAGILAITFTYIKARKFIFPEDADPTSSYYDENDVRSRQDENDAVENT